ncbi:MAG: hypothetical protein H0U87_06035 [Acidobacteria bacterium]|jgi:hypothetical protein|nr:hypothetical protein [Acidobacteriota bacterium]
MQKINQIIGGVILFAVCSLPAVFAQNKAVDLDVSGFIQESILKTNRANFRLISDYEYKIAADGKFAGWENNVSAF